MDRESLELLKVPELRRIAVENYAIEIAGLDTKDKIITAILKGLEAAKPPKEAAKPPKEAAKPPKEPKPKEPKPKEPKPKEPAIPLQPAVPVEPFIPTIPPLPFKILPLPPTVGDYIYVERRLEEAKKNLKDTMKKKLSLDAKKLNNAHKNIIKNGKMVRTESEIDLINFVPFFLDTILLNNQGFIETMTGFIERKSKGISLIFNAIFGVFPLFTEAEMREILTYVEQAGGFIDPRTYKTDIRKIAGMSLYEKIIMMENCSNLKDVSKKYITNVQAFTSLITGVPIYFNTDEALAYYSIMSLPETHLKLIPNRELLARNISDFKEALVMLHTVNNENIDSITLLPNGEQWMIFPPAVILQNQKLKYFFEVFHEYILVLKALKQNPRKEEILDPLETPDYILNERPETEIKLFNWWSRNCIITRGSYQYKWWSFRFNHCKNGNINVFLDDRYETDRNGKKLPNIINPVISFEFFPGEEKTFYHCYNYTELKIIKDETGVSKLLVPDPRETPEKQFVYTKEQTLELGKMLKEQNVSGIFDDLISNININFKPGGYIDIIDLYKKLTEPQIKEVEQYFDWLTIATLYSRRWRGPGYPYPYEWFEEGGDDYSLPLETEKNIVGSYQRRAELLVGFSEDSKNFIKFFPRALCNFKEGGCVTSEVYSDMTGNIDFGREQASFVNNTIEEIVIRVFASGFCTADFTDRLLNSLYYFYTYCQHLTLSQINKKMTESVEKHYKEKYDSIKRRDRNREDFLLYKHLLLGYEVFPIQIEMFSSTQHIEPTFIGKF